MMKRQVWPFPRKNWNVRFRWLETECRGRLKLEWHYSTRGDMERYRYWLEEVARMDVSSMQRLALFLSLEQGGGL